MAKIIDFIIIICLIAFIIYLVATMFKVPKQEIKPRSTKEDVEIIIQTLKMKLKEAHEDAVAGKASAISKMIQYESELEEALKLLEKYN